MSQAFDVANLSFHWGMSLRNPAYTGSCMKVRRIVDDVFTDIDFVGGFFDRASYESFIGASSGVLVAFYDQFGGMDLEQTDPTKQPPLVFHEGMWKVKYGTTGEKWVGNDTPFGDFDHIGVSIVWQGPTDLAGLTAFRADLDLGSALEFITGQWTAFGAPYSRHGGDDLSSWGNWDSRRPRHDYFRYDDGTATIFNFGVQASITAARTNPSLDRVRWGTGYTGGTDFKGNHYGIELSIYTACPDPVGLAQNVIAEWPDLFSYDDVVVAIGDSNLQTGYTSSPGLLWTRYAYARLGFTDWFTLGQGASTLNDWISRIAGIGFYYDELPRTGKAIAVIALGTNDIFEGNNAASTFSRTQSVIAQFVGAGAEEIFVCEVAPRVAADPFNAEAIAYNAILNADTSGDFKVIKVTDNKLLLDPTNTEFYVDGTHFTASGQREFGVEVTRAIAAKVSQSPAESDVKEGTTWLFEDVEKTGTYDGSDRWSDPGEENVLEGVDYMADGRAETGTLVSTDPGENNVKNGLDYVINNADKTGTYTGSDQWTDPGEENVLKEVEYVAAGEQMVGTFDPDSYFPTQRQFLDDILREIGAATLTDVEYDSIELIGKHYDLETYNALMGVLDGRDAISSTRDRLTYFFQARGVEVVAPSRAQSKIYVGSGL